MTGPEHYVKAERLAAHAEHLTDSGENLDAAQAYATLAAVHATLADAAATAFMPVVGNEGETAAEWRPIIVPPREGTTHA